MGNQEVPSRRFMRRTMILYSFINCERDRKTKITKRRCRNSVRQICFFQGFDNLLNKLNRKAYISDMIFATWRLIKGNCAIRRNFLAVLSRHFSFQFSTACFGWFYQCRPAPAHSMTDMREQREISLGQEQGKGNIGQEYASNHRETKVGKNLLTSKR